MITIATRTKEWVLALYRVDCDTWEEAKEYIQQNVPDSLVILASVKPRGDL